MSKRTSSVQDMSPAPSSSTRRNTKRRKTIIDPSSEDETSLHPFKLDSDSDSHSVVESVVDEDSDAEEDEATESESELTEDEDVTFCQLQQDNDNGNDDDITRFNARIVHLIRCMSEWCH